MSDIITLPNLKTYLSESSSTFDTILAMLISAISEAIEKELGRSLIEATYTGIEITGNGSVFLYLPNWPVTTLTSLTEDDVELYEGKDEDFRLYTAKGILEKLTGCWSTTPKGIVVTYKAGYTISGTPTMPKDLQLMCYHKIARAWKEARSQGWGETSRSFPDGSVNTIEAVLFDKEEMAILDNYRRTII